MMNLITSFLVSVLANVVSYFICKLVEQARQR